MTHAELRQKFLDFFAARGHAVIPSAPLVPLNDPTVLFTTAGMHPLVPYLLGEPHPEGTRLADVQKCVRTGDIDEVGDDTHLTFFEMLGNWSLGDYFKEDAIAWSFEFLTSPDWLGIPLTRLAFTCFAGDDAAPKDDEAARIWTQLGVPETRIAFLGRDDNWWGPAGETGPCGPDTEMFYWVGNPDDPLLAQPFQETHDDPRWVEIWNDVFMQYRKTESGTFEPLTQQNVDTGMGVERTLAVLNGVRTVYETEPFVPVMAAIRAGASQYDERRARIVADHTRAAAFIIADGVDPSNKDRGYVLRRLLRRAMLNAHQMGMHETWYVAVHHAVQQALGSAWPELVANDERIQEVIAAEAAKFHATLEKGLKEFEKLQVLDGKAAFDLYQTYGFPFELTRELAQARGFTIDEAAYQKEIAMHQSQSRTASAGQFKGGLADHSEVVTRYHTATHLLNAALRRVLGDHVMQKGSNINAERTRFDFSHPTKLTDEQKHEVEVLVNSWIERDLPVMRQEMPLADARKLGAIGAFGEKYGDVVSVYTVEDPDSGEVISREFCGGPHVTHTGTIGHFRIIKEEAVSAGVRRIKATIS